jgi:hypothetical protein
MSDASSAAITPEQLIRTLRRGGAVLSGAEFAEAQCVDVAAIAQALAPLIAAGSVIPVDAKNPNAASIHYLLPRRIEDVGHEIPVWRINAEGQPSPFATMTPLESGAIWVDEADGVQMRHDGLPWFLNDMRPQGFMGRTFALKHPELHLGADPRHWSDDDVLRALALYGDDLPGNLVVGAQAFERWHTLPERASRVASTAEYPAMANRAMQGTMPGSSAGGEQPKFCTISAGMPVIVKFSPPGDNAVDQRVRDLLVCEHLALQTLLDAGIPAAHTRISEGDGRVFLESRRFDRTGERGRIGMVSLLVYDAEYVGTMDNWAATANRMAAKRLLTSEDAVHIRLLEAFGIQIANTDRHYGNISLLLRDDDWALSPTYDMLPMLYAPVGGELVERSFDRATLAPTAATTTEWSRACALATAFWRTIADDERISSGFRQMAAGHATANIQDL